jgi:hypothetical protein
VTTPRYDPRDSERVRWILKKAAGIAKKVHCSELVTWIQWDEKGSWEQHVHALFSRLDWPSVTLTDAEIDEAIAQQVFITGARAILAVGRSDA